MSQTRRRHFIAKPLAALASPGMYLVHKFGQYKRQQQESQKKKVTEKELQHLNHKIDKLLAKLDEHEQKDANSTNDEECVVCLCAKATMQTMPCGHKVVCRKCFVKTIQVAVTQRCLPLRCVVCRTRILKLKQEVNTAPMTPPTQRYSRLLPGQEQSPVHHINSTNRHPLSFTKQFVRSHKQTAALTRSPGAGVRHPHHHRYGAGVTCSGATGSSGGGAIVGLFDSKQQPVLLCNEFKKPHHHPVSSLSSQHHVTLSPARSIPRNSACTNSSQKKHRMIP